MKLGIAVRSMGPQATAQTILACAASAEALGLHEIYVQDHIAIPPDQAEGSDGRYLDPLTTLAFLAARTERIGLGTGVLILPYRRMLPTAKAIATVQELSGDRLVLGVGAGWMKPEFRALGIEMRNRGRDTDRVLAFLKRCFDGDEVEEYGQRFLFRPRPTRPPILVGGAPPHALERAVTMGDGWMPMARSPDDLIAPITRLRELAAQAGRPDPEVAVLTALPLDDSQRALESALAYREVGATRLCHASGRYSDAAEFHTIAERLAGTILPAIS